MPSHVERRNLPFAPRQMFDLVADVERYPEFLPHMLATRVTQRDGNTVHVDMLLGMGILQRRIGSVGVLHPTRRIDIISHDPPFKDFELHWRFEPAAPHGTTVELRGEFAFRSRFWQRLLDTYFAAEVVAMVEAFEQRARRVHAAS